MPLFRTLLLKQNITLWRISDMSFVWLHIILHNFQVSAPTPIDPFCDNFDALHLIKNHVFYEWKKYVELDCHMVRKHTFTVYLLCLGSSLHQISLLIWWLKALPADLLSRICSKLKVSLIFSTHLALARGIETPDGAGHVVVPFMMKLSWQSQ